MLTIEQKKLIEELHPNNSFLDLPEDLSEHLLETGGLESSQFNLFDLNFNAICSCGFKFKRLVNNISECPICRNTKFKSVRIKIPEIKKVLSSENPDFSKLDFGEKSFGKRYKFVFENNEIKVFNIPQTYKLNWFTNEVSVLSDKKEVYHGKIIIEDERVVFYDTNDKKINILLFVHLLPKLSVKSFVESYNLLVPSKPLHYIENMTRLSLMDMLVDERSRILSELFDDYVYIHIGENDLRGNHQFPQTILKNAPSVNTSIDRLTSEINSGLIKETPINEKSLNAYELLDLPKSIVKWMVKYYKENVKDFWWAKNKFIYSVISIYQRENKNTGLTLNLLNVLFQNRTSSVNRVYEVLIPKYYYLVENNHQSSQLLNYMKNEFEKQVFSFDNGLTEYEDYVRMSISMNVPYTKYPKNLVKVHDVRAKDYQVILSKEESIRFQKVYKDNPLRENVVDKFTFVTPKSSKDLVIEGQKLRHCVASYSERVVKEECLIYMMRKTNNLSESFVTIEVANKNVVQVRGKHNRIPEPNIKEVVKKWAALNKFRYIH